ncbi:uncharacterized protein V1518DRAFT_279297 [Limtongia smithiae]|uniref:uncharacterized protein n=1 Tax=Limtongia smithiae TaxID=1125753 RepID=UPI0034CF7F86
MHDLATHSFLSQIPLTLSPYLKVPQPVSLPPNYSHIPSALPKGTPTAIFDEVKSVLASVDEQQRHVLEQKQVAAQLVAAWEAALRERDTMKQRSIAPGYLDSPVHLLQPLLHQDGPESELLYSLQDASILAPPMATTLPAALPPTLAEPVPTELPYVPSLSSYASQSQYSSAPYTPAPPLASSSGYSTPHPQQLPLHRTSTASSYGPSRGATPAPLAGPPLPPLPPLEYLSRPLRLATRHRPTLAEFPMAANAAYAARLFGQGSDAGYSAGYGDVSSASSSRTNISTLYEGAPFRRSSLPRLDSNYGRRAASTAPATTAYDSIDAKLEDLLGIRHDTQAYAKTYAPSITASIAEEDELPSYATHASLPTPPEKRMTYADILKELDRPAPGESPSLIDFDSDLPTPAPSLAAAPVAAGLIGVAAAPVMDSVTAPGMFSASNATTAEHEAEAEDDLYASSVPQQQLYMPSASVSPVPQAPVEATAAGEQKPTYLDSEDEHDEDFDFLTQRQSSASLMAPKEPTTIEEFPNTTSPPTDFTIAPTVSKNHPAEASTADTPTKDVEESQHGGDAEADVDELLRQLQEEIDEEERAAEQAEKHQRELQAAAAKARAKAAAEAEAKAMADLEAEIDAEGSDINAEAGETEPEAEGTGPVQDDTSSVHNAPATQRIEVEQTEGADSSIGYITELPTVDDTTDEEEARAENITSEAESESKAAPVPAEAETETTEPESLAETVEDEEPAVAAPASEGDEEDESVAGEVISEESVSGEFVSEQLMEAPTSEELASEYPVTEGVNSSSVVAEEDENTPVPNEEPSSDDEPPAQPLTETVHEVEEPTVNEASAVPDVTTVEETTLEAEVTEHRETIDSALTESAEAVAEPEAESTASTDAAQGDNEEPVASSPTSTEDFEMVASPSQEVEEEVQATESVSPAPVATGDVEDAMPEVADARVDVAEMEANEHGHSEPTEEVTDVQEEKVVLKPVEEVSEPDEEKAADATVAEPVDEEPVEDTEKSVHATSEVGDDADSTGFVEEGVASAPMEDTKEDPEVAEAAEHVSVGTVETNVDPVDIETVDIEVPSVLPAPMDIVRGLADPTEAHTASTEPAAEAQAVAQIALRTEQTPAPWDPLSENLTNDDE